MSDEPLTPDELASATIDGEDTGSHDDVAANATLTMRVAELRAAAAAIATPVAIDAGRRDAAVAAALAVFDEEHAAAPPVDATDAPDAPDARVRALRHRRINQTILGAAAAVVVLIGAVALLTRDDTSTSDTASAPATIVTDAAAGEAGAAPTSMASTSAAPPAPDRATSEAAADADAGASSALAGNLGDIDNPAALQAALADAFGSDRFQGKAPLAPQPCEAAVRAATTDDLGVLTEAAALRWMGQPAHVFVFVDADDASHIVVAAEGSCAVLTRID